MFIFINFCFIPASFPFLWTYSNFCFYQSYLLHCTTILVILFYSYFCSFSLTRCLSPPPTLFSLHLFFVKVLLFCVTPTCPCTAINKITSYPTTQSQYLQRYCWENLKLETVHAFHLQNFSINVYNIWYTGFTKHQKKSFSSLQVQYYEGKQTKSNLLSQKWTIVKKYCIT
jgi:hypothetical protein